MNKEKIYEVAWRGPYTSKNIERKIKKKHIDKYVLYKIYGSHHLYGNNILLYIGMTEQGVGVRLQQHNYWMDEERFGLSQIYVASIGEFNNWEESDEIFIFEKPERELISKIESLLIYAHQPVHNSKNRNTAEKSKNIRIFNTCAFGSLMPEVSALYQNC